jgi:hypothetical protein
MIKPNVKPYAFNMYILAYQTLKDDLARLMDRALLPAGSHRRIAIRIGGPEMPKKLTITVDAEVYDGLHRVIGRRRISRFLNDLARPHVVGQDLAAGYAAMAADEGREADATAWSDGLLGDVATEPVRRG